jgi:hypothetical protein
VKFFSKSGPEKAKLDATTGRSLAFFDYNTPLLALEFKPPLASEGSSAPDANSQDAAGAGQFAVVACSMTL